MTAFRQGLTGPLLRTISPHSMAHSGQLEAGEGRGVAGHVIGLHRSGAAANRRATRTLGVVQVQLVLDPVKPGGVFIDGSGDHAHVGT
jgi:hypothetical protein